MSKRNLYTFAGIFMSFIIAIGGWALTSTLIDRKSDALLSATGSVRVDVPVTLGDQSGVEPSYEPVALTEEQIVSVLQNWEADGEEKPHEPVDGQLAMEQAIDAGKDWLSYFYEQGVIPAELLEYDKTSAYLCVKQPRGQENHTLNPYYSYWSITFSSDNKRALLVINAVTGQIWDAAISGAGVVEADAEKRLDAFVSYLGLKGSGSLVTNSATASKSFADGAFYAAVRIGTTTTSLTDGDSVSPMFFRVYLSTKAPIIE